METELERLAKQLMLRDLRRLLSYWEEGKYTWWDLGYVSYELETTFENWAEYEHNAERMLKPEQLPLFNLDKYSWLSQQAQGEVEVYEDLDPEDFG